MLRKGRHINSNYVKRNFSTIRGYYKLDSGGIAFRSPTTANFIASPKRSERHRGPLTLLLKWGSFPGVKRHGRETHHSSPYNFEVMNARNYSAIPPVYLYDVRKNFAIWLSLIRKQLCRCIPSVLCWQCCEVSCVIMHYVRTWQVRKIYVRKSECNSP